MSVENVVLNSVRLDDLNNDVLLEIFDYMEFEDLFNLADSNLKFRELISHRYAIHKYRVHEKLIKLDSFFVKSEKIDFGDDIIHVGNTAMLSKFLRNFGHLISRLQIEKNINDEDKFNLICRQIHNYCSESLTEMSLGYNTGFSILWKHPFKKLTKLHLERLSFGSENNINDLPRIFPSLEKLDFGNFINIHTFKCFNDHFPHLEYVKFPFYQGNSFYEIKIYERFIEANPQIRNVHIRGYNTLDLLRLASEKLQNIEFLKLNDDLEVYPIDLTAEYPISFNKLKKLDFHGPLQHLWLSR